VQNLSHENEVHLHENDPDGQSSLCFCRELTIFFVSLQGKVDIPSNRVEQLYEAMLPNLPQYVVSFILH